MKNLLKRFEEESATYSKSQRRIADYITENYDKAAFMTASKLASAIGTSESTVVRFAVTLGYEGYPEMQKHLQDVIRKKLTATQRIELTTEKMRDDVLSAVLHKDAENILSEINKVDRDEFNSAVECILSAKRIYIIGVRASSSIAQFLGFYLNHIFPDVNIISTVSATDVFEHLIHISKEDVFIGVSFPRYSKRTINAMAFAHGRGARVIAITDSETSPLCDKSDYKLTVKSGMVSFVDSLVAPLSLVNALIAAISMRREKEVSETLSSLETIWDEFGVYEKFDNE